MEDGDKAQLAAGEVVYYPLAELPGEDGVFIELCCGVGLGHFVMCGSVEYGGGGGGGARRTEGMEVGKGGVVSAYSTSTM